MVSKNPQPEILRKRSIYRKFYLNSTVVGQPTYKVRSAELNGYISNGHIFLDHFHCRFTELGQLTDRWPTTWPNAQQSWKTCSLDSEPTWVRSRSEAGSVTEHRPTNKNTILEMELKEVRLSSVPLQLAETWPTVKIESRKSEGLT